MPPNEQGEVLCGRNIPVILPGVALGYRDEYAWFDKRGRLLRLEKRG
jgi:hypothetical protein